MKVFTDCENWGNKLCDGFVKHLYEPTEGYKTEYTSADEEKAKSICNECPHFSKK